LFHEFQELKKVIKLLQQNLILFAKKSNQKQGSLFTATSASAIAE